MVPGQQTVRVRDLIFHIGGNARRHARVRAHGELLKVEGRKLTFRLWAEDEGEAIAEGTHERLIISVERFDQRMQKLERGLDETVGAYGNPRLSAKAQIA